MYNGLKWMVIYPMGNKSTLDIAQVLDYEQDDWGLASFKRFDNEEEACSYAWELSKKSGIPIRKNSDSKYMWILDSEE